MDIVLSKNSKETIYEQIFSQISRQILNGTLLPNTQLPPIRTIANELRISVIPVKMAWEELDRKGLIKTVVGKGSFVSELSEQGIVDKRKETLVKLSEEICKKIKAYEINVDELFEEIRRIL